MNRPRIMILVNSFSKNGGASKSIRECAANLEQRGYSVNILCFSSSFQISSELVYLVRTDGEIKKALELFDTDIVIFFKAAKSLVKRSIFNRFIEVKTQCNKRIGVITIVCQQPSNPSTILTPFEIKHSDHLIFIDKTAYNDTLYSFIPDERKSWTYLSIPDRGPNPLDRYLKTDYALKNEEIVFGRGSSFNKCPRNILEPFDNICIPFKKKFIIVGVPNNKNWLTNLIKTRRSDDVVTYPMLGFEEWMKLVSSFDIGLYYLPKNAHSSIDGTLGQMMRIGLPVIVGGAPAPKERIFHGENGFIADTVPEIVKYAEMLANSQELRERIGLKARQSTIELNSKSWIDKLENLITKVSGNSEMIPIHIPLKAKTEITIINIMSLLKAWIVRPINKALSKK